MKPSSAGLVIIWDKKILLEHPTNAPYIASYSIPKGEIEPTDINSLDAAIREVEEECGIKIPIEKIDSIERLLTYKKDGKIYKKIFYYVLKIDKLEDIGLSSEVIPSDQLQLDEVDWAGFLTFEEALPKIIRRQVELLRHIHKY